MQASPPQDRRGVAANPPLPPHSPPSWARDAGDVAGGPRIGPATPDSRRSAFGAPGAAPGDSVMSGAMDSPSRSAAMAFQRATRALDEQAADAESSLKRVDKLRRIVSDLGRAAARQERSEAALLGLQEENSRLAASMIEESGRAAEAAGALKRAEEQVSHLRSQLALTNDALQQAETRVQEKQALLSKRAAEIGSLASQSERTMAEYRRCEEVVFALQGTSEGEPHKAPLTAADVHTLLATMGVTSIGEAAAFGPLPELQGRAEASEEAAGRLRRRLRSKVEELEVAENDMSALSVELQARSKRSAELEARAMALEAELEATAREMTKWRQKAMNLSEDLRSARHFIGDLSVELEARELLRQQLDTTMNRIKAVAITLDARGVDFITRTMRMIKTSTNPDKEHHFKTAHNVIKKLVIDILGERPAGASWRVDDEKAFLTAIPTHSIQTLHRKIQQLVIAYDNMSDRTKNRMSTAREVVANAQTLLAIARHVKEKLPQTPAKKSRGRRAALAHDSSTPGRGAGSGKMTSPRDRDGHR